MKFFAKNYSYNKWLPDLPKAVVLACSDGRIQEYQDKFLEEHLGTTNYDRVFIPGGPGALAVGDQNEYKSRSSQVWAEVSFMIEAHLLKKAVLIFHGAAGDGPEAAVCGDYFRVHPDLTGVEMAKKQIEDALAAKAKIKAAYPQVSVEVFRLAVDRQSHVQFILIEDLVE